MEPRVDPPNKVAGLARWVDLFLDRYLAGETMKIDRRKAAPWELAQNAGDTISMGAADTTGHVDSYIQSQ